MADSRSFEFVCGELERLTKMTRLEARGTVRLALKEAGLSADAVLPLEMQVVLQKLMPKELAARDELYLEPLTGTGLGVIGALAAVGLRTGGNDGRFLWLPGLREIEGVHEASRLRALLHVDTIETEAGTRAGDHDRVFVGDWPRPLLRGGLKTLLVEETRDEAYRWSGLGKERLKQLSG